MRTDARYVMPATTSAEGRVRASPGPTASRGSLGKRERSQAVHDDSVHGQGLGKGRVPEGSRRNSHTSWVSQRLGLGNMPGVRVSQTSSGRLDLTSFRVKASRA